MSTAVRRRRLASEAVRHGLCLLLMLLGSLIGGVLLRNANPDHAAYVQTASVLFAWASYGPLFLLLSWLAFRGLRGPALAQQLRLSRPPRRGWQRWFFISGPRAWSMTASAMALIGVLSLTVATRNRAPLYVPVAGITCVLGTWVLLLAVFTVEYARQWADGPSFRFPDGDDERSIVDFLYAAVQVSTTFSSSDVEVLGTRARLAVISHCLAAWAFTTVTIALVVSLALQ